MDNTVIEKLEKFFDTDNDGNCHACMNNRTLCPNYVAPDYLIETEDGVRIKKGESVYWVRIVDNEDERIWSHGYLSNLDSPFAVYKYFKEQKAMRKFIIKNNDKLTIKDLKNLYRDDSDSLISDLNLFLFP